MADQIPFHFISMLRADRNFRLAFSGDAIPLNVDVDESGELMRHPLENGSKITDHIVFEPVSLTIPVMIQGDYRPVVEEIRQAYRAGTLFTIITRGGTYRNMVMSAMPHEENTEVMDAVVFLLRFGEAVFVKAALGGAIATSSARRPKLASTTKRGQVQAAAPATPRGSFLYRQTYGKK